MSDRHIRLLRAVARHRQRKLDDLDAAAGTPDTTSTSRRRDLARVAARTRAQLAAAEARRGAS